MTTLGSCRLCRATRDLQDSHIVPRWAYRRIVVTGKDPNPVFIDRVAARRGGKQFSEPMLCTTCEARLGVWDKFAAEHAVQDNGSFPAFQAAVPSTTTSSPPNSRSAVPIRPALALATADRLDLEKLVRFGVSVLWRAGESGRLPDVQFGAYAETVRNFLLDDHDALPDGVAILTELFAGSEELPLDKMVVLPHSRRAQGYHVHRFSVFGLTFTMLVGGRLPDGAQRLCTARSRQVLLTDGSVMADHVRDLVAHAKPLAPVTRKRR